MVELSAEFIVHEETDKFSSFLYSLSNDSNISDLEYDRIAIEILIKLSAIIINRLK